VRVINTAVALTYKKKLIEIYGDLALLTSKYNVPKQRKKKRLCIIPHYVDFENEVIQEYKEIFQDEIEICTLSNKSAQLELNLSFLLELSIKKYICTMTTKKNLSEGSQQRTSESLLKDIRRNTKRIFTSEQKGLIVMGESVVSIVLPSSAVSISVRNIISSIFMASLCIRRHKER